jgi:hypothetical protein
MEKPPQNRPGKGRNRLFAVAVSEKMMAVLRTCRGGKTRVPVSSNEWIIVDP